MLNVLRDAPHSKARFVALGVHTWAAAVAHATQSALEPAFSEARRAVQALALDPCEQVTWTHCVLNLLASGVSAFASPPLLSPFLSFGSLSALHCRACRRCRSWVRCR